MEANWNDQVGTSGYSKLAIQPLEYATKHGLPPALCKVLKYLLRDRGVCKLEDYAKMRDCIIKGKDLTDKYPDSYKKSYGSIVEIHKEFRCFEILPAKKYIFVYFTYFVTNNLKELKSRDLDNEIKNGEQAILDLEDLEAEKHGYREAAENESPDLDYTKFSGRKWVKIQKDV